MKTRVLLLKAFLCAISLVTPHGAPMSAAFTYQGRLLDGGTPANGAYDLEFSLFDAATGGKGVGAAVIKEDIAVANGLFQAELDFGPNAFGPEVRWLGMGVRPGAGAGAFLPLPARQMLYAAPQSQYALVAGTVTSGSISADKIVTGAVTTEKLAGAAVTADKLADGSVTAAKLATDSVTWAKIRMDAITGPKIAAGEVVKSVNGLHDNVSLLPSATTFLTTNGNALRIHVASSALEDDFVSRSGGTISGGLALDPPAGAQALMVRGNRAGGLNDSVAYFRNNRTASDAAPAIRAENLSGTSPDGTISVSNNGEGYIARFGNAARYVASLGTEGTLRLHPDSGQRALLVEDGVKTNMWVTGNGAITTRGELNISTSAGLVQIRNEDNLAPGLSVTSGPNPGVLRFRNAFEVWPALDGSAPGKLDVRDTNGAATITLSGLGVATVKVLEITGGADIAEPFPVTGSGLDPGSVMIIDPDHPGRLKLSHRACDSRVAGVLSGANGVKPGLALRQAGRLDQGPHLALSGRVYVKADAAYGAIRPGDLLTTSDTPGHAMKATDSGRAQGAVLGKAMSSLDSGQGFVLVLITLQ